MTQNQGLDYREVNETSSEIPRLEEILASLKWSVTNGGYGCEV